MKKLMVGLVSLALLVMVTGVSIAADSQPSAKATAAINKLYAIGAVNSADWVAGQGWTTVHSQQIKTANAKDLFIDVALQCGLYTRTKAELKVGEIPDTSTAQAQIEVRVVVDNVANLAEPGAIVFDKRVQTLSAQLYQALLTADGASIDNIGFVELIQETLQAHAFNFVMADVTAGLHTITVQARVVQETSGDATALGAVGIGSTTIESVRMIKGEDVVVDM
ncbi:MAG: hypothetical protein A4E65_02649 [Syntrophorhabdus sp. PtaU1.Bin153]|nr:MAG: hypothetical protein A4E65_02649 [Syntrophorhabdus sp. PtaU1.Bin153]